MISKKIILGTLGGLVVLASTCSSAAQIQLSTNDVVAREASEGPRGEGKGHKNGIDAGDFIIAREATEAPRGADNNNHRRNRGGRVSTDNPSDLIIAREASEGPRGEGKGHKNGVDASDFIIAREATEAPRGADNNNHRRNRGGRVSTENVGDLIIAREASEGPRGRDRVHTGTHKNGVDNQSAILA